MSRNIEVSRVALIASNRRNRGVVIYYMTVIMIAMCGFASLAVDLGRVQVVKAELRCTADASARAAAAVLPDTAAASALAIEYASSNAADGAPVTLDPSADIEFGTWDSKT